MVFSGFSGVHPSWPTSRLSHVCTCVCVCVWGRGRGEISLWRINPINLPSGQARAPSHTQGQRRSLTGKLLLPFLPGYTQKRKQKKDALLGQPTMQPTMYRSGMVTWCHGYFFLQWLVCSAEEHVCKSGCLAWWRAANDWVWNNASTHFLWVRSRRKLTEWHLWFPVVYLQQPQLHRFVTGLQSGFLKL